MIISFLSASPFISVSMCFVYFSAPILGAYTLMSIKTYSYIDSFYQRTVALSFIFMAFVLKSILSDMCIVTSAFLTFLFT